MKKFRKKPIEVEAVQFSNKLTKMDNKQKMLELFGDFKDWRFTTIAGMSALFIQTLEGEMRAEEGDWIIKGINGEFYPCKQDIFEKTYEAI